MLKFWQFVKISSNQIVDGFVYYTHKIFSLTKQIYTLTNFKDIFFQYTFSKWLMTVTWINSKIIIILGNLVGIVEYKKTDCEYKVLQNFFTD